MMRKTKWLFAAGLMISTAGCMETMDSGYGYAQQAAPYTLASKGKRFGGFLLEILLVIVTLVIGWIIWWVILWKQGQSPAKSILKMRVYKLSEGRAANTSEIGTSNSNARQSIAYGIRV